MTSYVCDFYRSSPFDEVTLLRTLSALNTAQQGFFPLTFWRSSLEKVLVACATDFNRQLIPSEYFIEPSVARIPFEAANGAEVVFTESDNPAISPPHLGIEFEETKAHLESWSTASFFALFKAIAATFDPEHGHLADIEELTRPEHDHVRFSIDINHVPISLHWINYFGERWVQRIGAERLKRLSEKVPAFEWLGSGAVLFALQEEPFRESDPKHVETQRMLEATLDLKKLHREHPNLGI